MSEADSATRHLNNLTAVPASCPPSLFSGDRHVHDVVLSLGPLLLELGNERDTLPCLCRIWATAKSCVACLMTRPLWSPVSRG